MSSEDHMQGAGTAGAAIVVIGSMNTDLVTYVHRAPGPGETVIGRRFQSGFGGKGANQAAMARLLGADVTLVGALGDDAYADLTLENFARLGIDAVGVMRVPGSSGVAPIWVDDDGTNRIIVVAGANDRLTPDHAAAAVSALGHVHVAVGQFEVPQAATAAGFAAARAQGAVTILNPAPAAAISTELLAVTDWLIPNESEFAALAATAGGGDAAGEAGDAGDDALRAFAQDHQVRLIVTLGAHGAALVGADGTVTRVPARAVAAIDTSGAGDAFVGAFAVGIALGWREIDALALGLACASDSVTRAGTQASFPDRAASATILAGIARA